MRWLRNALIALSLLLALLLPVQGWAAPPTLDSTPTSSSCTTASGVMTWSHTVTSGDALFVFWAGRGTKTVSSVTWNGSSTGVAEIIHLDEGAANASSALWRVIAPTSGTHDIVLNHTSDDGRACAAGLGLVGVHQTTPSSASASNGNGAGAGSNALTVTVACDTGALVVGMGMVDSDASYTSTGTGQTERVDVLNGSTTSITVATQTGAASTVHSYTADQTDDWNALAACIQPPDAVPSGPPIGTLNLLGVGR